VSISFLQPHMQHYNLLNLLNVIHFKSLKVHHYIFLQMCSSLSVKIFGEETAVFCCCICCYMYKSSQCACVFELWVVFSIVVCCAACLVREQDTTKKWEAWRMLVKTAKPLVRMFLEKYRKINSNKKHIGYWPCDRLIPRPRSHTKCLQDS
jgi:hypothetical protein